MRGTLSENRKLEWLTEHRLLSSRVQLDQQRIKDLEEMLDTFFPEARRG